MFRGSQRGSEPFPLGWHAARIQRATARRCDGPDTRALSRARRRWQLVAVVKYFEEATVFAVAGRWLALRRHQVRVGGAKLLPEGQGPVAHPTAGVGLGIGSGVEEVVGQATVPLHWVQSWRVVGH